MVSRTFEQTPEQPEDAKKDPAELDIDRLNSMLDPDVTSILHEHLDPYREQIRRQEALEGSRDPGDPYSSTAHVPVAVPKRRRRNERPRRDNPADDGFSNPLRADEIDLTQDEIDTNHRGREYVRALGEVAEAERARLSHETEEVREEAKPINLFDELTRLEAHGILQEDLEGTRPSDFEIVTPARLERALYSNETGSIRGLLVGDDEYTHTLINPGAYSAKIKTEVEEAARVDGEVTPDEVSARVHTQTVNGLSLNIYKMYDFLNSIEADQKRTDELRKLMLEPDAPGSTFREISEDHLNKLITEQYSRFVSMLELIAKRERWDAETLSGAHKALAVSLFSGPIHIRHIKWNAYMDVNDKYGRELETRISRQVSLSESELEKVKRSYIGIAS